MTARRADGPGDLVVVDPMRGFRSALVCLAAAAASGTASAAGVGGAERGVTLEETLLVVWDATTSTEHLLLGARGRGKGAWGVVFATPNGTKPGARVEGATAAFGALSFDVKPPLWGTNDAVVETSLDAFTEPMRPALSRWLNAELTSGRSIARLPVQPGDNDAFSSGYSHLSFTTEHAFLPFAEPEDPPGKDAPPIEASVDHPPRIRLWAELGAETKDGAWERAMDRAAEGLRPALVDCYVKLARARALEGDLHIGARLVPGANLETEEPLVSSKAMEGLSTCFAPAIEATPWPAHPGPKAASFEIHAMVRPPGAETRTWRAFVLTSENVDPRLGNADDPRAPSDMRTLVNVEPTPSQLAHAFDVETRTLLGIDPSRRWRLMVLESTADPRPSKDDIALRTLAATAEMSPDAPPLPVVARGDLRTTEMPAARVPKWKRKAVRVVLAIGGLAGILGAALWMERGKREDEAAPGDR